MRLGDVLGGSAVRPIRALIIGSTAILMLTGASGIGGLRLTPAPEAGPVLALIAGLLAGAVIAMLTMRSANAPRAAAMAPGVGRRRPLPSGAVTLFVVEFAAVLALVGVMGVGVARWGLGADLQSQLGSAIAAALIGNYVDRLLRRCIGAAHGRNDDG